VLPLWQQLKNLKKSSHRLRDAGRIADDFGSVLPYDPARLRLWFANTCGGI